MKKHIQSAETSECPKLPGFLARVIRPAARGLLLIAVSGLPLSMSSCTTDAYGNTAVTPGGAAAIGIGAAAAGAITAAAISNHSNRHHYHHRPHYRPYHGHYHGHRRH